MKDREMSRLEELLIDRATGDLSPEDEAVLRELLKQHPEAELQLHELVAGEVAAALVAQSGDDTRLPADLFERGVTDGEAELGSPAASRGPAIGRPRPWMAGAGWIAAAAAAVGWFLALDRAAPVVDRVEEPTLAEVREGLIERAAAMLTWTATEDLSAVAASGDVVWSDTEQAGVMRIAGLDANDPTISQYQLWIFDEARDESFPVDGGVFDIPAGETEVLVPIRAAVPVTRATLFAVTVERPGGVVVSDRERIVLLALAG